MALQAPHLDDRRFQQLVDEAKRQVGQRCPEWTDHNVSDPGVTLIELFAGMVDQLLYRLNRVPDRHYVKFLDLLGVHLHPPADAEADVTFWLSAPLPETLHVPVGTQVATRRTEHDAAVEFSVVEPLAVVPCRFHSVIVSSHGAKPEDRTADLRGDDGFPCFDTPPKPGDAMLVGLDVAVPRCAVALRFDCRVEGVGVDPDDPPLRWESWNGAGWSACELEEDGTGGLNKAGDVVLHVSPDHVPSSIGGITAGWLRCRLIDTAEGQASYLEPPKVHSLSAFTMGGTALVAHSEVVQGEEVGRSNGLPGQCFALAQRPVAASAEPLRLEVLGEDGTEEWTAVRDFGDSGADDRHFVLDPVLGEIVFGPEVREADGSPRRYGAVPPAGTLIRVPVYRTGGGPRGNVAKGQIAVLKSSIPYVTRVQNRRAARGGVEAETVEDACVRGPLTLRTRSRAVTIEDYEQLAREAAPDVARVRCIPAAADGPEAGSVRVLVVPAVGTGDGGGVSFSDLLPPRALLATVSRHLDERRLVGARVLVEPPDYHGFRVTARVQAQARVRGARLQAAALDALYRYFHPSVGGPDGTGWPFGRPVNPGDVYSVLQRVPGTEYVEQVQLFATDAQTGERLDEVQSVLVGPNALVFGDRHQVAVREAS